MSKTARFECVSCGEAIDDPAEHHRTEHLNERWDPVWYIGGEPA